MKLRKTNENINRSYDAEGNMEERVDGISYEVRDDEGNSVGNAYVGTGNASVNINLYGFGTVADGEAKLKELLGIEAPNP